MKRALYFGCLDGGHYLHSKERWKRSIDPQGDYPGFPWDAGLLDGGLLENGKVPDMVDGRVRWACGGRPSLWYAFYWWDRSGDKRHNSSSGLYVQGFELHQPEEAFEYACGEWPDVVARQVHPLVLLVSSP